MARWAIEVRTMTARNVESSFPMLALAMTMFVASCRGQTNADWKIDIGIRNVGTNMMDEASVKWGEFRFTGGFVSPSNEAVHVAFDHPIPETAAVHYSLPDGREVMKTVVVKSAVPVAANRDKDITVMFEVNSNTDDVTVKFLHFIQRDGYAELVPFDDK